MSETKLNQTLIDKIAEITLTRISVESICALSGFSKNSYYRWLKQGKKDIEEGVDSVFAQFALSIKAAEAQIEQELLDQAIGTDEVGARWYLSRKMRKEYGDKQEIDIKGELDIEIVWPQDEEE